MILLIQIISISANNKIRGEKQSHEMLYDVPSHVGKSKQSSCAFQCAYFATMMVQKYSSTWLSYFHLLHILVSSTFRN